MAGNALLAPGDNDRSCQPHSGLLFFRSQPAPGLRPCISGECALIDASGESRFHQRRTASSGGLQKRHFRRQLYLFHSGARVASTPPVKTSRDITGAGLPGPRRRLRKRRALRPSRSTMLSSSSFYVLCCLFKSSGPMLFSPLPLLEKY